MRLAAMADRSLLKSPPDVEVDGLGVWCQYLSDSRLDLVRSHLTQALVIIKRFDPMRFQRIKRDLAGIIVSDFRTAIWPNGIFMEETRTCQLVAAKLLAAGGGASLMAAITIVHEATHARLCRLGFNASAARDERCRIRQERVCKSAELAFLLRVPKSDGVREILRAELALTEKTFATETIHQRRAADFRRLGIPGPVARWLARTINPLGPAA
jgi:hypothetical protein